MTTFPHNDPQQVHPQARGLPGGGRGCGLPDHGAPPGRSDRPGCKLSGDRGEDHIFSKTGLRDRGQLVGYAFRTALPHRTELNPWSDLRRSAVSTSAPMPARMPRPTGHLADGTVLAATAALAASAARAHASVARAMLRYSTRP